MTQRRLYVPVPKERSLWDIQSCLGSVGFRDELSGKTLGSGFRDQF